MVDFTQSDGFVTDAQGRRQYANRDDEALVKGTEIDATDHNEVRNELVYLVSQAGMSPSNKDLTQVYQAVQKLVAAGASSAAVGFTPVEQGGHDGLKSDKINIGNSTGGLAAYVAGNYYGVLATQAWANGQFLINSGGTNGGIVRASIDAGTGTPSFLDGVGNWNIVASNAALQAEIQRATTVESNLQSSKYDKAGGILTGTVTVEGNTGGVVVQYNPGSPPTDTYVNYPGFVSIAEGRGGQFFCQLQEHVGYKFAGLFSLQGSGGKWRYVSIPESERINDSAYGAVAYTADLASCVPAATYASDFATSDNRVINLPYGHCIQSFQANVGDGTTAGSWIPFPVAFSGTPVFFQANSNGNGDGATDTDYWCYGATAMGMFVRPRNHQGSANIIVIGPK